MFSARIVLWLMLYAAAFCNTFVSFNLSIVMVSMVKYTEKPAENVTKICKNNWAPFDVTNRSQKVESHSENSRSTFEWNENDRNLVLGAYNVFPWISQLLGGFLVHKYGTKVVVGWSTFIGCLMASLIPPAAFINLQLVVVVRTIQGILMYLGLPVGIYAVAGFSVGAATTFAVSGFIADAFGWPYVFYLTSVLGTLWFIGWQYCVYDSPDQHPRISMKEKLYIQNALGSTISEQKLGLPIPWKCIITSMPFTVNIVCQVGAVWSQYIFSMYLPTYFKVIHGLNAKSNGLLSGTPYVFRTVFSFICAVFVDSLIQKDILSKTGNRNLVTVLSSIMAGLSLLPVAFAYCKTYQAIIFIFLSIGLSGGISSGAFAACVDMSPNFSGVLSGIAISVSMIIGALSPVFVTFLGSISEGDSMEQWKMVWLLTGVFLAVTGSIFVIWSNSELQPWNDVRSENGTDKILLKKTVSCSL